MSGTLEPLGGKLVLDGNQQYPVKYQNIQSVSFSQGVWKLSTVHIAYTCIENIPEYHTKWLEHKFSKL